MRRIFALSAIVFLTAAVWIGMDVHRAVFRPFRGFQTGKVIRIDPGMSVDQAAGRLHQNRIIGNLFYFKIYYRLFFKGKMMKTGEYLFDVPLTMKQVIDKLHEGKVILRKVTIKEGWTAEEIARYLEDEHILRKDDFLRASASVSRIEDLDPKATDLEGYLFPDTYLIPQDIGADDLVEMMVKHFRRNITNEVKWRARDIHLTLREVVVLASLVEKETASRDERFLVSSVFHNRLRRQMLLDCDPTIIYVLKKKGVTSASWDGTTLKSIPLTIPGCTGDCPPAPYAIRVGIRSRRPFIRRTPTTSILSPRTTRSTSSRKRWTNTTGRSGNT